MHQISFTQHRHSYLQALMRKGHLNFGTNILHANQFKACPNLSHTRSWDPYLCNRMNLANSCSRISFQVMLFMPIESPEQVSKDGIFNGPKVGLDGLHGLAQVWTALPPM